MDPHSWLMLLLLVLVGIRWRKQRQVSGLFLWSAVAFVLAVLPSSGLIPVNQYRADRFVYLALAFGGLFCAGILQHIQRWRTYAALVSLVFIGFWTVQSYKYSEVWRSDLSLWSYVHGKDPFHPEANINIGSIAIRHGDLDTAEKYLERVFRKMPDSYHAWINLGLVWLYQAMQLSDDQPSNRRHVLIQKAEKAFRYTLSRYPEHTAMPLLGLAKIARIRGQHTQAEDFLRRGLNHKRTNVGILLELADLLKETKREEQASLLIRQYKPQFGHLPRFQQWIKKHLQAPPNTSTP
jgi:tetratricopeptide (TPR) repeat protein